MRIVSLNVGGIHSAVEHGLFGWLLAQDADVICLQDTRASCREMEAEGLQLPGYFQYVCDAGQPELGGVAIYSRLQPKAVIFGLGFEQADHYGRYLQADFDKVSIASLLLPSGVGGEAALQAKFRFMEDFAAYLNKQRRKRREFIYCGSLYVAHQKPDVRDWRDCQQQPGCLSGEREWLDNVLGNLGYVDALREISRDGELYSWWPEGAVAGGLRTDYQLLTPGLRRFASQAWMPREPRFGEHSPLLIDYDWTLSL